MSFPELLWRFRQFIRAELDRLTHTYTNSKAAGRVRKRLPPFTRSFRVSYFNISFEWNGEEICWHGENSLTEARERHWHVIDYRDTERYGDPKLIWELNRHQFLKCWAQDAAIPPQEKAVAVSQLILQWIEMNPAGRGINWCSSLEISLRIISWESAIETVGDDQFHPRVLLIIKNSVREHQTHLLRFPSRYSSANNHRIGELLGLIAAAALFSDDPALLSHGWEAWEELQKEVLLQVSPDGFSREKALYYHIYVMLFARRAMRYAIQLQFPIFAEFRQLLERMQGFLNTAIDDNGNWFELGDRDDGNFTALMPWTEPPVPLAFAGDEGFYHFESSGIVILKAAEKHIMFRAGEFGYPSIAAHAHCDQLSVLLKYQGIDVLTDSGTCSYHADEKWRRYFRGTTAHNTVRINHCNQAEYEGPFLWRNTHDAELRIDNIKATAEINYTAGRQEKANHTRTLSLLNDDMIVLEVVDVVTKQSSSTTADIEAELIWNFGEGIDIVKLESESVTIHPFQILQKSKLMLILEIQSHSESTFDLYYGNESIPAGFISRQFGQRNPINQLRITSTAETVRFKTTFRKPDTL